LSTTIHEACKNGDIDAVNLFIKNGIDINQTSSTFETPIYIAFNEGHFEIVSVLLNHGAKSVTDHNKIFQACQQGNLDLVTKLLNEKKVSANTTNAEGRTPIFEAIQNKNFEVVKYLTSSGADLNKIDNHGLSVICAAAKIQDLTMFQYLLEKGAKLKDNFNQALKIASENSNLPVLQFIIDEERRSYEERMKLMEQKISHFELIIKNLKIQ